MLVFLLHFKNQTIWCNVALLFIAEKRLLALDQKIKKKEFSLSGYKRRKEKDELSNKNDEKCSLEVLWELHACSNSWLTIISDKKFCRFCAHNHIHLQYLFCLLHFPYLLFMHLSIYKSSFIKAQSSRTTSAVVFMGW